MAEADPDYDASHDLESEVETEDEDLTDEVRRICDKPAIFLTIFFKFVKLYYAVFLPFFCTSNKVVVLAKQFFSLSSQTIFLSNVSSSPQFFSQM